MIRRTLIALLCSLLIPLTPRAAAQESDPNAILEASKSALGELAGFSTQFRMRGEGGSMFADTLPSMSGQLFFGTNDELGRVIHIIGESRDQQTAPSQPIDILIATDRYLWTDRATRTINERPITNNARGLPSAISIVLIDSIIQSDPFAKDANNAQSIELQAQETVSDTLCDGSAIKRAKPAGSARRSGSDSYTDARWYIGADDKLPRKVEHITDAGLVKITLSFELSQLNLEEPTQTQLDIARPEGFVLKSTMPKPTQDPPQSPSAEPTPDPDLSNDPTDRPSGDSQPTTPAPRINRAPPYAFTPEDGTQINNTTQDGRVTVLYFWGSWCVPCNTTSPLVSQLAEDFGSEPVDVFGLAIREADPEQTRVDFNALGFRHALVLDAQNAVAGFKVRVFPTITVINSRGEIVFQQSINKETTGEDLVDQARSAISDAINDL